MSNLIITVIAIGLVALLALAGAYYGGSYLRNMHANADAAAFLNVGNQTAEAWRAYRDDHNGVAPLAWSDLVNGGYLMSIPQTPAMAGGVPPFSGPLVYNNTDGSYWLWSPVGTLGSGVPDTNATACLKIIKLANGGIAPAAPQLASYGTTTFTDPNNGNGTFGCAQWNGGGGNVNDTQSPLYGPLGGSGGMSIGLGYMAFYKLQDPGP
jgi:hypothetical protein